jgi:outer membrane protein TolC
MLLPTAIVLSLALAEAPLTLEQALSEARAANATLPVARAEAAQAGARVSETRAALYPHLELDGEVQVARPGAYADSHALAKVLAATTIYDSGRRRAEERSALSELQAATFGVRKAEEELALEVRLRFDELASIDEELTVRQAALEQLRRYRTTLEERRAGGQGVGADLLKTQARALGEEAELEALGRERETASHELNDLLGRDPQAELTLAPVPDEAIELDAATRPWERTGDVAEANASAQAAREALAAAQTESRPKFDARAELGGVKPLLGSTLDATDVVTAPGSGFGGAVAISASWPLFDFGAIHARVDQARAASDKALGEARIELRNAHLQWSLAWGDHRSLTRELSLRTQAAPVAKDAYLSTEALFRGGVGGALEVLDAFDAWVDADVKVVETRQALRDARARLLRWEGR